MYEAFYGLNEKPFNLTPDPRFLYLSPKHEEAFAHLLYGIQNRSGFVMVSGEIGTGKTTICRSLLRKLDSNTDVAFVFNPRLSPEDLLRTINEDFGIDSVAESIRGLIDELNDYLLQRAGEGKNCVLIIDEAQNLDTETLEQVRLLSNLETETEKLLQIILIGQPELPEKLKLAELRQLDQRITARYHLTPLNQSETLNYIAFRLRVAGGRKRVRFTRAALRLIYKRSGGTPRVINAICDRALLIGYTKETREITPPIVKQAAREVRGDDRIGKSRLWSKLLPASAFATASIVVVATIVVLTSGPPPRLGDLGSFARSQWQWVVELAEALPRNASPPEDAQGRRDGPQEVEQPDFLAAAGAPLLRNVSLEAGVPPEILSRVEPVGPSSPKIAEAASHAGVAAEGGPAAQPKLLQAKASDAKGAEGNMPQKAKVDEGIQDARQRTKEAFSAILSAWSLASPTELPDMDSIEDVYGYARAKGLSFARRTLSLKQVLAINLPFLAQVRRGGDERWVAVLSVESGDVTISAGAEEPETIALEEFGANFTREAVYIWSNPDADATPLRARSGGFAVWELQDDLRSLGLMSREPTGVYDAPTIEIVSKIQRTTGLLVDGIVGPQTRMVLGNWLEAFPVAALAEPAFSEETRLRVLSSAGMVIASQPASDAGPESGAAAASVERLAGFSEESGPEEPSTPPLDSDIDFGDAQDDASGEGPPLDFREKASESGDLGNAEIQAQLEEIIYEGGGTVLIERLDRPGYRPQLELDTALPEDSVTQSAGPIVPIVPSDLRLGERLPR